MRTMKIMVAAMAMIIGAAAFNTISAQGRQNRGNGRHEVHQNGGNRGGNAGHVGNKGGHVADAHRGGSRHDYHYDAHHNNVGHHNHVGHHNDVYHHSHSYHIDAHHPHYSHAIAYHRPVCHYYNNLPVYVHHYYRHTAPVVIRHWGYGYVPVVGDIVDCLPDNYISVNIGGVHFFRALGHLFRPISIDGALRFIIE